jgi:flap endonuclease-1
VKTVSEHGDIWSVFEARDVYIENVDRIRTLFLDPPVTDDVAFDAEIEPDMEAAREFVVDEWSVAADEVERGFERIADATVQTGLDRWT